MVVHVAQWLTQGVTLSPVEPSEGMELAKHGVVNTGLVFFVAAILVTAVFGRFFCGWGCHLVALQDLSRWLLIRSGITPRPIRSRLLGFVPLIAFLYMFCWPAVYKLAVGLPLGPLTSGFLTTDFWATFPGLTIAVLTFMFCGFAIVFVLGAKGYCTYGCPYGAAFGLADRVAPIRVRVTDACQGCATCTSVCTSNVRVHEEVRDHGMVIDPGCMKCLDCVANCPNEALYVGAGKPAVGRRGRRRAPGTLRGPEELIAGVVFVLGFLSFRGLYGQVPFLFSLGIAAILAGMVIAAWRMARMPEARLGPIRLKTGDRVRKAGRVFLAVMAFVVAFWIHAAVIQGLTRLGDRRYDLTGDLRVAALDVLSEWEPPAPEAGARVEAASRTLDLLERWSPVASPVRDRQRAWLAYFEGDRARARSLVERALAGSDRDAQAFLLAARLSVDGGRWLDAARSFARAVEVDPFEPAGFLALGTVLGRNGRLGEAFEVFSTGLETHPASVGLRYNVGLTRALLGDVDGAVRDFELVLELDPDHLPARENLAGVLAGAGRFEASVEVFEEAVRRSPDDPELRIMAGRACLAAGLRQRAAEHVEAAIRLDPSMEAALEWLGSDPGDD
jgi:tetratricopeptide (TPR) repeat protein/NAD-dependent dihydropyrimidine dehydrogenase PreA subunit